MRLCVFLITNSIVKFCDYFFQHILCCYSTSTQTGNKRLFTIFQYMICCYSTIIKAFEQAQKEVFQYIPCYYLTFPVENPLINLLEFQYISCCYSTNTILFNFIKSRPFQYIICCYSTINKASLPRTFRNFNTSYVIIQPTKNRHPCILLISINHDLKPFSNILPTIPLKISYS